MSAFLLQHLLRDAAARAPARPAVNLGDDELTYGELEAQSNRIARVLVAGGVRRGDRVVLHTPKSTQAVAALYGILKAGAAYVPIEPGSPAPRVADIVEQCGPRCVVTWSQARQKLSSDLCRAAGVTMVASIDDAAPFTDLGVATVNLQAAAAAEATTALNVRGVDHDLAYVLFTSGSTGKPKGVMLTHLNALTFVNWAHDTFALTPDDRLSNHAPFNFDLSVLDLFAAAAAGARVTLVPERLAMFPTQLADLADRERLTVWYSVPSVLTLLLTRGNLAAHDLTSLRWILFAGEVFPTKYLRQLLNTVPSARFGNLYGPTETNVVTWYEVERLDENRSEPIPIGKACAGAECVVLDEAGEVVTVPGREGVLHVRGPTVMRGYFGEPEATAAAFVRIPDKGGQGDPLYCTGDWVTLDENGDFHYRGRRDHMVKIRGYRVELGEIETALYAHAAVREAAVVAVPDDAFGNTLRAFVVVDGVSAREIRAHCATLLPRYMVPEDVELVAELPRTTTDKVNRQGLAALRRQSRT